ncbi:hypothetical protein [Streptomyces galilaeus]|uniref:hypothetical protein n=1 Tax=Streptomyces galilaeus TaxID=33899 RepID=UPI001676473E|nr:hypothetical protein [Streptomyces galilaeus]GGW85325.1 hypothetical protein GCM10010350_82400 [Streptomyces galilaeus]
MSDTQVRPDFYTCQYCGSRITGTTLAIEDDERLVVIEGILQILAVPDGHQVITPERRCYAPHLGASMALALRLNGVRAVFPGTEAVKAAEGLRTAQDADERGPWVLSPVQLDALTRAMDVRNTVLPSTSRQQPALATEIRDAHARSRRTQSA